MKKIFLSSTTQDLAIYRQAIYDAIEDLEGYHCIRMENFGARDANAKDFDIRKIEECDLFVGILGYFHGSTPENEEQSYTEQEYDIAKVMGKPRFIFLSSAEVLMRADLIEPDEKRRRQQQFRQRIASERIIHTFNSPLDLAHKVVKALFNWEHEQAGRDPATTKSDFRWSAIPLPPQPHLAHPYPLQDHFTGRVRERQMLSNWLNTNRKSLLVLVGIGGLGKSSLTWVWLHQDILIKTFPDIDESEVRLHVPEQKGPEGVIWWSFYESDATFSTFLDEALHYVSQGKIAPERIQSHYHKARLLLALLQQRHILLIFDGFERVLRAYAGLGGVYQSDHETAQFSDPHSCVDPVISRFLISMVSSPTASRILITSRLFPKELEDFSGLPLAGCQREDLERLDPADAITFFQSMGISGTRSEIKAACAPYGYHALTLRLLAGYIIHHFTEPGEIKVALNYNPMQKLIARRHNILDLSYNSLTPNEQALLSRIAAFRSPVPYIAISALTVFKSELEIRQNSDSLEDQKLTVFKSEQELQEELQILVKRGLLFFERERGFFDMHPIVRSYAYERLTSKENIHARLRSYFVTIMVVDSNQVRSIEQLIPTIELFHHTIRAGLYQDAFQLYKDRLSNNLQRLGLHQTDAEMLEPFLRERNAYTLYLEKPADQEYLLNSLGIATGYIGQTRQALAFFNKTLEICMENNNLKGQITTIGSIAFFQMRMGELKAAEEAIRRGMTLLGKTSYSRDYTDGYEFMRLGLIMTYTGRFAEALKMFRISQFFMESSENDQDLAHLWTYRVIRARIMGDYALALVAARRALKLAEVAGVERQITRSKYFLGAVLVDLATRETSRKTRYLAEAEILLTEALTRCHQANLIELEANILLNWARWQQFKGDVAQSRQNAENALAIAIRCEYRLEQAEAYNFLAQLSLEEDNKVLAHQYAQSAQERAWCDGSPYSYQYALEEAFHLLELSKT
jgi:hypothetical protein